MLEPRFLIVSTGWNCHRYVKQNFDSIKAQTYTNYKVVIVDDGSPDSTFKEICDHAEASWDVISYRENNGTYYARDGAIHRGNDYDVVALLDMDDALLPDALELAAQQYAKGKWMTYGNYENPLGMPCAVDINYAQSVHDARSYRKDTFRCTHLRTFRRELYEAVPLWKLTKAEVESYPDVEILFSMMEMCGQDKIGVIQKPIYIYNTANPLSTLHRFGKDHKGYYEICNRPKRELLQSL